MRTFFTGKENITQDSDAFVIAEIGNNHQGERDICLKMMKKANNCGANAVKLQKKNNKTLYTSKLYNSPYENDNSFGRTYGEHKEVLELPLDDWIALKEFADHNGILLFATAFDIESAYFLEKLDMPLYKIASGCMTDFPLIETIASFGKPMIISTGGWAYHHIDRLHELLKELKAEFAFLHCIASYPNKIEEMNLNIIADMMERYPKTIIGLSDHHSSVKTAIFAYFKGARIIEKHFTLSRAWKGPDHSFSLEPKGLETLCEDIKDARLSLGKNEKVRLDSEQKPITKMSKAIYAVHRLKAGEAITESNIAIKIPGEGLEPYHVDEIIGKVVNTDVETEQPLTASMFNDYSTEV